MMAIEPYFDSTMQDFPLVPDKETVNKSIKLPGSEEDEV